MPKTMGQSALEAVQIRNRNRLVDCAGNELRVGARVAYNQSGNILPGVITEIHLKWVPCTWVPYVTWRGSFRVKNDLTGKISVVKRPQSMMVFSTIHPAN